MIKNPMDMDKMTQKLYAGQYMSGIEFKRDVDLMVENCCYFNDVNSPCVPPPT